MSLPKTRRGVRFPVVVKSFRIFRRPSRLPCEHIFHVRGGDSGALDFTDRSSSQGSLNPIGKMSEPNRNTSAGQSSQGSGDQSGNPNRNRNRNRNRSRNRNRDQQGEGGGRREGGGQGGQQRRRHNNAEAPRRRSPKPKPLTLWQKILKFVGISKPEPARPAKKAAKKAERPPKENVRDASGRANNGGSGEGGGGGKTARARQKPRPTPDSSQVEGKRLYIGNLSYDAAEHDLEDLLKGVGAVRKIEIVYNRNTHRSKGYGFAEMARVDEAKRAVEVLHDQPFMGRTLIVNGAKSKGAVDSDGDPAPQENPPPNLPGNEE